MLPIPDQGKCSRRNAVGCKKQVDSIRSECSAFHSFALHVRSVECTGNDVTDGDIIQASVYGWHGISCDTGVIRKILCRNGDAPHVTGDFKLMAAYEYAVATPLLATFLDASGRVYSCLRRPHQRQCRARTSFPPTVRQMLKGGTTRGPEPCQKAEEEAGE